MELTYYNKQSLIEKIKADVPGFDEEELLEFARFAIPNVHLLFSQEKSDILKKYCSDDLIKKVLENKKDYRISSDNDITRVGYSRLQDYKNENNEIYVKVYNSVFFYDRVSNNQVIDEMANFDKYWNDIWVVTFQGNFGRDIMTKCPFCGAKMEYNSSKHMFTCENCRDSLYYSHINWKIVDIEVNKINYK